MAPVLFWAHREPLIENKITATKVEHLFLTLLSLLNFAPMYVMKYIICLFSILSFVVAGSLSAQNRLNLPKPKSGDHPFDFARFLDNEVTPLKDRLDEFFTIYASGNADRLIFISELINTESRRLFNELQSLERREGDEKIREAYLSFAQFAMNSSKVFNQVAAEAPSFPDGERNPDLLKPKAKEAYLAAVRLRKGYISRVQHLLQTHQNFGQENAEAFANYPASKLMQLLQDMKRGTFARPAVYLDFLADPESYERGTRYVFQIDQGMVTDKMAYQDQFDALSENISNALQSMALDWKMEPWDKAADRLMVIMPARYAYPRAPLAVIRLKSNPGEVESALTLELYSQVPGFLKK